MKLPKTANYFCMVALMKNNKCVFPSKVCFETLKNVKETKRIAWKIYAFRGSCRKPISCNFTDISKFMILFHLPWLGEQSITYWFANFWKIKIEKQINFFSSKKLIFLLVLHIFTGKRLNIQKVVCDGIRN